MRSVITLFHVILCTDDLNLFTILLICVNWIDRIVKTTKIVKTYLVKVLDNLRLVYVIYADFANTFDGIHHSIVLD